MCTLLCIVALLIVRVTSGNIPLPRSNNNMRSCKYMQWLKNTIWIIQTHSPKSNISLGYSVDCWISWSGDSHQLYGIKISLPPWYLYNINIKYRYFLLMIEKRTRYWLQFCIAIIYSMEKTISLIIIPSSQSHTKNG